MYKSKRWNDSTLKRAMGYLDGFRKCIQPDGKLAQETVLYLWHPGKAAHNIFSPSYPEFSEEMLEFWEFIRTLGYLTPFEYVAWMQGSLPAYGPDQDRGWIKAADKETIDKIFLCLYRSARFHEGLWASQLCNGYMYELYKRLLELEGFCLPVPAKSN